MIARSAVLLPLIALTLALTAGDRSATAQTEMTTIRVASTPIDVGAQVYYAQALGMFKAADLDVQIQQIDNGAAIAAAVAGGSADIGQSNVVSLATHAPKESSFCGARTGRIFYINVANDGVRNARECAL